MSTNVPSPSLSSIGYAAPQESDILNGVIQDIQSAFGNTLNLDINNTLSLSTPQGQLASSLSSIISNSSRGAASLSNLSANQLRWRKYIEFSNNLLPSRSLVL